MDTLQRLSFGKLNSFNKINLKKNEPYLLISYFGKEFDIQIWNYYLNLLPIELQMEVNRFRKWQDRYNCLFGKLLLYTGYYLVHKKPLDFKAIMKNMYGRPYLKGPGFNFNISHSGNIVVCAFGTVNIGVDIERIINIDVNIFNDFFSSKEMNSIREQGLQRFYQLWTTKEAVSKALGEGLHASFLNIERVKDIAKSSNENWFVHDLILNSAHCAIASSKPIDRIKVGKVFF